MIPKSTFAEQISQLTDAYFFHQETFVSGADIWSSQVFLSTHDP